MTENSSTVENAHRQILRNVKTCIFIQRNANSLQQECCINYHEKWCLWVFGWNDDMWLTYSWLFLSTKNFHIKLVGCCSCSCFSLFHGKKEQITTHIPYILINQYDILSDIRSQHYICLLKDCQKQMPCGKAIQ